MQIYLYLFIYNLHAYPQLSLVSISLIFLLIFFMSKINKEPFATVVDLLINSSLFLKDISTSFVKECVISDVESMMMELTRIT